MQLKPTHGGKRLNAGRKQLYSEPTQVVAFKVPTSKVEVIKALVNSKLATWVAKEKNKN